MKTVLTLAILAFASGCTAAADVTEEPEPEPATTSTTQALEGADGGTTTNSGTNDSRNIEFEQIKMIMQKMTSIN